MKLVIFYTRKDDREVEVGRVWNENGELKGTVNEVFLDDLKDWLMKSSEGIEDYLAGLHKRFDGAFLYAGLYEEEKT